MAKDPAFLFYPGDFLTGVSDLTMEERGQYITLLCLQHAKGVLSEKTIRLCVGSVSVDVISKFKKDTEGNFINERLATEIEKRAQFIDSRRVNGKLGGRPKTENKPNGKPYAKPLGYPTDNLIINEDINEVESEFVLKKGEKLEFELNLSDFGKIVEFVRILTRELITHDQITERWEAFKIESESEFYLSREKKINHFRNWLKNRIKNGEFKSSNSNGNGKLGTSAARDQYLQSLT